MSARPVRSHRRHPRLERYRHRATHCKLLSSDECFTRTFTLVQNNTMSRGWTYLLSVTFLMNYSSIGPMGPVLPAMGPVLPAIIS